MRLIKTQAPATYDPTGLMGNAKAHAKATDGESDVVRDIVAAAVEFVEAETRQQLLTGAYTLYLDGFPACREISLPRPPLQAVASVKYVLAGIELTLDPAAYTVDPPGSKPGRVTLNPGGSWPEVDETPGSVRVAFTAGYGTDDLLPAMLRQAVLLTFAHWYESREGASEANLREIPMGVRRILDLHQWPEAV